MTGKSMHQRRIDIDFLKALGCFLVILYHLRGAPLVVGGESSFCGYYLGAFMSACVPLFFLSSGALYAKRDLSFEKALRKALFLVFLTYFWAVLSAAFFDLTHGETSVATILGDALTLRSKRANHLWFLPALATAYLAAPVLIAVRKSGERLWNQVATLIVILAFGMSTLSDMVMMIDLALGTKTLTDTFGILQRFNLLRECHPEALAFFTLGMWMDGRELPRRAVKLAPAVLALSPVPLALRGMGMAALTGESFDVSWRGMSSLSAALIVVALYIIARGWAEGRTERGGLFERVVSLVARNSFAVYIFHWFARPALFNVVPRDGAPYETLIVALAFTTITMFVCALLGELIKKTPLRALLA